MGALEALAPVDESTSEDWAEVYRCAWRVVRRIGGRITDPGFDLEDMVQVAVAGAWQTLSSACPDTPDHARHLLYKAMRSAVYSEFRRIYRQPERTYDEMDLSAHAGTEKDPLTRLCERASVQEIRAFIQTLSPIEQAAVRAAVTVRLYDGGRGARVITSKQVDNALQRVRKKAEVHFTRSGVRREGVLDRVLGALRNRSETAPGGPGAIREQIAAWANTRPESVSWVLPRLMERGLVEVCGQRGRGRLYRLAVQQEGATA